MADSLPSRRGPQVPQAEPTEAGAPSGRASLQRPDAPPTSRALPFELIHDGATDIVACAGPCMFMIIENVTPAGVDAMAKTMAALSKRYEKMCTLSVIERKLGSSIDAEGRRGVADISRKYTSQISGTAVVCEGSGFRATAIRSIVTAVRMASRASHPSQVFAGTEPALAWLASTQPAGAFNLPSITHSVATLRARLQEHLGHTQR